MIRGVIREEETIRIAYDAKAHDVQGWVKLPAKLVDQISRGETQAANGDLKVSLLPSDGCWILRVCVGEMVNLSLILDDDPRELLGERFHPAVVD